MLVRRIDIEIKDCNKNYYQYTCDSPLLGYKSLGALQPLSWSLTIGLEITVYQRVTTTR